MNFLYKWSVKILAYRIKDKAQRKIWRFNKLHPDVVRFPGYSYAIQPTSINPNTKIGKFVSIGTNCLIGAGMHPTQFLSTHPIFYQDRKQEIQKLNPPCTIGNDVWIGHAAVIRTGVTIGHGAVIGSGAVVTKDVPPYAIVGGIPAQIIRYRFDEQTIDRLIRSQWWDLPLDTLKTCAKHITDPIRFLEDLGIH